MDAQEHRQILSQSRRVVVKAGSRTLVQRSGRPDRRQLEELVRQVAHLREEGREVVLVSSGAIGTGMEALGMKTRPRHLPELQMAAAVGQSRLMGLYGDLFERRGLTVGQVLLTHDDLKHRSRHLNARTTMMTMLRHGIVPIVNENDVVAVEEIKFGDNDHLASLVAMLVEADVLVLLTTVDGLREPAGPRRTRRVPFLDGVTGDALGLARGKGSELSTGGMRSKLQSAAMVVASGIPVVIANGRAAGALERVFLGQDEGTFIAPHGGLKAHKKRWLAFFQKPHGAVVVDDGARDALVHKGRSLLAIGVRGVEGEFGRDAVVNVKLDGRVIARGQSGYASEEIRRIQGRKTAEIPGILGGDGFEEVIHRDRLVVIAPESAGAAEI
jgi:glutamate 5-kinase